MTAPAPHPHSPPARPRPTVEVRPFGGNLMSFVGSEEPPEDDEADWTIRGLIARGMLTMLVADPKVGKTLLALDWAISIAAGESHWCGYTIPEAMRGARVLVMPKEDIVRITAKRVWQLCRGHNITPANLIGKLELDAQGALWLDDATAWKRLEATTSVFDVVLIDSLSKIHHGDENSARDMAPLISRLADLASASTTDVVLLHHLSGKGQLGDYRGMGHRMRGSSSLFAAARWIVGIERREQKDPSKGILFSVDGNLGYRPDPFVVRLQSEHDNGKRALRYTPIGGDPRTEQAEAKAEKRDAARVKKIRTDILESIEAAGAKLSRSAVLVRDGIRWVTCRKEDALKQIALMINLGDICTDGDVVWAKSLTVD